MLEEQHSHIKKYKVLLLLLHVPLYIQHVQNISLFSNACENDLHSVNGSLEKCAGNSFLFNISTTSSIEGDTNYVRGQAIY